MKKILWVFALVFTNFSVIFADSFDSNDWVMSYYKNPSPEKFIEGVRDFSEKNMFENESSRLPTVGFLSGVFANNPTKVKDWLSELSSSPKEDLNWIYNALLYSKAEVASELFKEYFFDGNAYDEDAYLIFIEQIPPIFEMPLDHASVLDMNWAYFFATGDQRPIRHIIEALNYAKCCEYQNSENTYLFIMFQTAMWSIEVNCRDHPLILKHCESIFTSRNLTEIEKVYLALILNRVKPEQYQIEFSD